MTKKNVGGSFTFEAYNSKEYTDGISFAINQDGQYKVAHVLDNKWGKVAVLATKDDLSTGINAHIDPRIKIEWSNDPVGLLITVDRNNKRLIPSNAMTTIS